MSSIEIVSSISLVLTLVLTSCVELQIFSKWWMYIGLPVVGGEQSWRILQCPEVRILHFPSLTDQVATWPYPSSMAHLGGQQSKKITVCVSIKKIFRET